MDQPSWDDDAVAWRRYAGQLRERMGEAKRKAEAANIYEARAIAAEARAIAAEARAEQARASHQSAVALAKDWEQHFWSVQSAKRRDKGLLDQLEALLLDGDVPAAVDLLAARRSALEAAAARRMKPARRRQPIEKLVGGAC